VEKLSGKDAGKDAGGGAAVEHTNFAARDCDTKKKVIWDKQLERV